MDNELLLKALEDEENESLLDFTPKKIRQQIIDILDEICETEKERNEYFEKLKDYRYIENINDLKYGSYLRWIPIKDLDSICLKKGGHYCHTNITETGNYVICKNVFNTFQNFKIDECIVFQKLSDQEKVLLNVMSQLSGGS
jgi:hypothetical protein